MTERAHFLINNADAASLRAVVRKLARTGYSEVFVRERLGLADLADVQWRLVSIFRSERLSARDQLDIAIDLFFLQGALTQGEVDRLLLPAERDLLIRAGLLAIDDAGLARARASLFPVGDHLIFSDHAWPELPHPGLDPVPHDQVMGIGLDSRNLARCTIRRPFLAALDICSGSGIHALLAATHTKQVTAVDINLRAARCIQFNARASGFANLEVLVGDVFEGLSDRRFDLITANPPFVPSPLNTLLFRDGGPSGEDIQKRIIAGLPDRLAPGGIAQIVTELGEREGESLVCRLREWLRGAPLDIHILRVGEHAAMKYAIGHAKGDNFGTFLDSVHDWARNLLAQRYDRVVSVVISFQSSDPALGPPWSRVDQSPPPQRPAGSEIEAIFKAERLSRSLDSHTLRQSCLSRGGPIALLDARVLGADTPAKAKATLLGQALAIEHPLDAVQREVLIRTESCVRVTELLTALGNLGVDECSVDSAIRSLIRWRLVRVGEPSEGAATPAVRTEQE